MEERHDNNTGTNLKPQLSGEEREILELVRMASRRHRVPCPDSDREWQRIKDRLSYNDSPVPATNTETVDNTTSSRIKLWAAAAIGVAAMLALVLCYNTFIATREKDALVALDYDDTPQRVTLIDGNNEGLDLSGRDSVSFFRRSAPRHKADGRTNTLSTPRGMDFKVTLSDGTEVWLNAESTIKFPATFSTGERRVELTGEAYFKVVHNASSPFVVRTGRVDVRVLGTEFNMQSYHSETPRVSLVKGSIAVINPQNGVEECRLKPGQDAWRDAAGTLHMGEIDTYGVTQWVDGFFYFDDVPLVNILRELGRWYNLGVVFHRRSAAETRLHFSASRKSDINEAVSTLNSMLKAKITVEGKNIVVR